MYDDLTIEVRIRFRGQDLAINRMMTEIDLEDLMPPKAPPTPDIIGDFMMRKERRESLVHVIAAQIADTLVQGLYRVNKIPEPASHPLP